MPMSCQETFSPPMRGWTTSRHCTANHPIPASSTDSTTLASQPLFAASQARKRRTGVSGAAFDISVADAEAHEEGAFARQYPVVDQRIQLIVAIAEVEHTDAHHTAVVQKAM